MAKLTKAEFDKLKQAPPEPGEVSDKEKKALITKVYDWQQANGVYAWDEESLTEELGIGIDNFTVGGHTESGDLIEVEFYAPLDEDTELQGVAVGYRLIKLQEENSLYTLQKYKKPAAKAGEKAEEVAE